MRAFKKKPSFQYIRPGDVLERYTKCGIHCQTLYASFYFSCSTIISSLKVTTVKLSEDLGQARMKRKLSK